MCVLAALGFIEWELEFSSIGEVLDKVTRPVAVEKVTHNPKTHHHVNQIRLAAKDVAEVRLEFSDTPSILLKHITVHRRGDVEKPKVNFSHPTVEDGRGIVV